MPVCLIAMVYCQGCRALAASLQTHLKPSLKSTLTFIFNVQYHGAGAPINGASLGQKQATVAHTC